MRLTALSLTFAVGLVAASAQEPKTTPVRDGADKPDPTKSGPKVLRGAEAGVGRMIPDVAFTDLAGKAGKLSDLKSNKLTVVAFTNTTCPVAKKYAPSLART